MVIAKTIQRCECAHANSSDGIHVCNAVMVTGTSTLLTFRILDSILLHEIHEKQVILLHECHTLTVQTLYTVLTIPYPTLYECWQNILGLAQQLHGFIRNILCLHQAL